MLTVFGIVELAARVGGVEPLAENRNYQERAFIGSCRYDPAFLGRCDRAPPDRSGVTRIFGAV